MYLFSPSFPPSLSLFFPSLDSFVPFCDIDWLNQYLIGWLITHFESMSKANDNNKLFSSHSYVELYMIWHWMCVSLREKCSPSTCASSLMCPFIAAGGSSADARINTKMVFWLSKISLVSFPVCPHAPVSSFPRSRPHGLFSCCLSLEGFNREIIYRWPDEQHRRPVLIVSSEFSANVFDSKIGERRNWLTSVQMHFWFTEQSKQMEEKRWRECEQYAINAMHV